MNIKKNLSNHLILVILLSLSLGLLLGWVFFGGQSKGQLEEAQTLDHMHDGTVWTCSMHPQVRSDEPGSCPICGMDLITVELDEHPELDDLAVVFSEAAMRLAEVQTSVISKSVAVKEVYLPGRVEADERRINEIPAHFPGRIEELFINFTGQEVRKGQVLATIYAPELITAQKELFEAVKLKGSYPQLYKAARNKFKLWVFTEGQIDEIEAAGTAQFNFKILSPASGTVYKRNIAQGDHIMKGMSMFQIVDLSSVWVVFDAYESDVPFVNTNDDVEIRIKSVPGQIFNGKVSFIEPVLDRESHTTVVRTELANHEGLLRPGMLANGLLKARLSQTGGQLMVPKSAILWTGKTAVVYVKTQIDNLSTFKYREIEIGEDTGRFYVINSGLDEGEEVATNGVFKIDAAAQLQGKPSMMNQDGVLKTANHQHN